MFNVRCSMFPLSSMNDLRYAFRQLLKNPGFTAVALLTLALGIGVNVAVFSMANAVLWRPLDLPEPNHLVQLGEGDLLNGNRGGVSAINFRDLAEHSRSFSRIAAMRTTALNLGGVGNPERLVGAEISEDYFSVLRVEPQLGRFLAKEDFASGEHVALISHRLWLRRFRAGTNILGKAIRLNGEPHTVVGVDRKSTRLNSSHLVISYAVFCLKKKKNRRIYTHVLVDH